jgi:hypothetical protein
VSAFESNAAAIVRVLQCVALKGFSCMVWRITSAVRASVMVRGLPGRDASFSSGSIPPSR